MRKTLSEIAGLVGGRVVGDGSLVLSGVASVGSARAGDLVFVEDAGGLDAALRSAASALVAGEFAAGAGGKSVLIVEHPRLAFARAAAMLVGAVRPAGVHASAVVDSSARLGAGVSVEAGAVIGAGVEIGAGSWIGPRVVVYPGTIIGARVRVHAGAVLGSDGFGYVRDAGTGRYEKFPQIGTLRIGDDVEIGANTTVDRGALDATVIGRGTKIDNLVHVGHNVRIGEDVVIAAQVGISGSCVIEDGVVMAGQVGLGDHAHVGPGVILGGQCGVLPKKVVRGPGELFWGTPARPVREYLKQLAMVARLGKKK